MDFRTTFCRVGPMRKCLIMINTITAVNLLNFAQVVRARPETEERRKKRSVKRDSKR